MKTMIRSTLFIIIGLLAGLTRLAADDTMAMKSEILAASAQLSTALAADNLADAKAAAATLASHAEMAKDSKLAKDANAIAKADDLSAARKAFKAVNAAVVPMAASEKGYVVMTCPMAHADWVQTSSDVKNPYYGKSMLTCGGPKNSK